MANEVMFWQILAYVILGSYLAYVGLDIIHIRRLAKLRKEGRMETKKGTYTFTPKEKTTNE